MPFLDELFGDSDYETNRTRNYYNRLRSEMGSGETGAMLQSDINRGVVPGAKSSWADELDPNSAAKLDRYAWGRQSGVGGIPAAALSELAKTKAFQVPAQKIAKGVGSLLNFPDAEEWFTTNSNSSDPSFGNFGSYLRGILDR